MPLSGVPWVSLYPTSQSVNDLVEPFRTNVRSFLSALTAAGASVSIAATLRPPQRAYLMHHCYLVATGALDPARVPPYQGVDIQWVHPNGQGGTDLAASQLAARQMMNAYGIVYSPALQSNHSLGLAIDMDITWPNNLSIVNKQGQTVAISSLPRSGSNLQLQAVGASYGVIKLATDPPHWSSDGH